MKVLNFPDDNTTLFLLKDIDCCTRIQSILKYMKKHLAQK